MQDIRFVGRLMRRSPGFYVLVVVTLGLGVGANLAIFTVANGVLVQPLPFHEPGKLVGIWEANIEEGKQRERLAPPNFADYLEVFADAAAWWSFDVNLTDPGVEPVRISTVECTANFFSVLGVSPAVGAGFADGDELYHPELAAVISDRLWRSRYGSDRSIIGRQITLNGSQYTVTGVMAAGFAFPAAEVDVWQRQSWDFTRRTRNAHFMEGIGRLPDGSRLEEVQAQLTTVSERLAGEYPATNEDWRARLVPLKEDFIGAYGPALLVLLGAVVLLALLASVNVANLLLSRSLARKSEIAIRSALGASSGRLLLLSLTEAVILGIAGAVLGTLLGAVPVYLLLRLRPPAIPRLSEIVVDSNVVSFGLVLAVVTMVVSTAIPVHRLVRSGVRLQEMRGADRRLGRRLLVILETALATALLVGAGLMVRSVSALLGVDPGFSAEESVTVTLELPATVYPEWPRVSLLYQQVLGQISSHPATTAVGVVGFLPLRAAWIVPYTALGRPEHGDGDDLRAQYITASDGLVEALGVPLLAGRTFSSHDDADSEAVVVVNEELACRTWSSPENAVGKLVKVGTNGFGPLGRSLVAPERVYEVIGVVGNTANNGLEGEVDPALFFTFRQFPYRAMSIVARSDGPPTDHLESVIREAVHQVDPTLPLGTARTLEALLDEATARPRFIMYLMACFAVLAIVIATVGIYGVLSYAARERRLEFAIRRSLGATGSCIRRLVAVEGLKLAAIGGIVGLVLAFGLTRYMSVVLFEVSPTDPHVFLLVVLLVAGISIAASLLPGHRAARADLSDDLRVE